MDISYLLLRRVPLILFVVVGIVIAIIRWKRHPKVSVLTILGLLLLGFQSLVFMFMYYLLPRLTEKGWSYASISHLYTLLQVCQDFAFAVVIIILVVAAFIQRRTQVSGENKAAARI